jgi:hypothetical protein
MASALMEPLFTFICEQLNVRSLLSACQYPVIVVPLFVVNANVVS